MRNIGDLRQWVELLEKQTATDRGVSRNDWRSLGRVRGEIQHMSARNMVLAGGDYGETVVMIHIRQPSFALTPGLRVRCGSAAWDVLEVIPDTPMRGFVRLRAAQVEMEGSGIG